MSQIKLLTSKLKPLVWEKRNGGEYANTYFGVYTICLNSSDGKFCDVEFETHFPDMMSESEAVIELVRADCQVALAKHYVEQHYFQLAEELFLSFLCD